jgi:hypothetical protein
LRAIKSNLTGVVDETTNRGQAMAQLIKQYLGIQTKYGLQNLGDNPSLTLPILFVEPSPGYAPELSSTGKYQIILTFNLYWYVVDQSPEDIVSLCSSIGHNLEKLFSNNALNDLGTVSPPSHNFCSYEPNWTDVMKYSFRCLPTFKNPLSNPTAEWMRLGKGTVEIRTWIVR